MSLLTLSRWQFAITAMFCPGTGPRHRARSRP
jgi:hypothetical protein